MSHNKAIEHGKEHRKQYTKAKAVDKTCRNHGTCPHCKDNRLHNSNAKLQHTLQDMEEVKFVSVEDKVYKAFNGQKFESDEARKKYERDCYLAYLGQISYYKRNILPKVHNIYIELKRELDKAKDFDKEVLVQTRILCKSAKSALKTSIKMYKKRREWIKMIDFNEVKGV